MNTEYDFMTSFLPQNRDKFPRSQPKNWTRNQYLSALMNHMEATGSVPYRFGDQNSKNGWTPVNQYQDGRKLSSDDYHMALMKALMGVRS